LNESNFVMKSDYQSIIASIEREREREREREKEISPVIIVNQTLPKKLIILNS